MRRVLLLMSLLVGLLAAPLGAQGADSEGGRLLERPFASNGGLAWTTGLTQFPPGDGADAPSSRLELLEDGELLGPAHALHSEIRELGAGRFSHWGRQLYFSTSDGSDPNLNGREYRVRLRPVDLRDEYPVLPLRDPFRALSPEALARAVAGDSSAQPADDAPPLILWYTIDALRADTWRGRAGASALMPELRAFAEQAVSFEQAYASSSFTKTSTASMFTGLWPARHGVMHGVVPTWPEGGTLIFDLDPRFYTLAEALRDRGYDTRTHRYSVHVREGDGLVQGFERIDWGAPEWSASRPLFVYEHVLGVHGPYAPSERAREQTALPPAEHVDPSSTEWFHRPLSDAELSELRAAYRAEAVDADAQLAERFAQVRAAGLWDDALIVVTADHGESFGEHGGTQHASQLYEESVRVPLLVKFPRRHRWAARHGEVFSQRVGLVDLYPTLLDVVGAEVTELPYPLDGRSLGAILDGHETDLYARDQFLRTTRLEPADDGGPAQLLVSDALLSGEVKALMGYRFLGSQRPAEHSFRAGDWFAELYALSSDPRELTDLAADAPEALRALLGGLRALHRPLAGGAGAAQQGEAPNQAEAARPDPEVLERLRALGYLK